MARTSHSLPAARFSRETLGLVTPSRRDCQKTIALLLLPFLDSAFVSPWRAGHLNAVGKADTEIGDSWEEELELNFFSDRSLQWSETRVHLSGGLGFFTERGVLNWSSRLGARKHG